MAAYCNIYMFVDWDRLFKPAWWLDGCVLHTKCLKTGMAVLACLKTGWLYIHVWRLDACSNISMFKDQMVGRLYLYQISVISNMSTSQWLQVHSDKAINKQTMGDNIEIWSVYLCNSPSVSIISLISENQTLSSSIKV